MSSQRDTTLARRNQLQGEIRSLSRTLVLYLAHSPDDETSAQMKLKLRAMRDEERRLTRIIASRVC